MRAAHVPLARHLSRFSALVPTPAAAMPLPEPVAVEPGEPMLALTAAALEARLAAARDEIRAALDASHAAEWARREAAAAAAAGQAMAALRAEHESGKGEDIAAQLATAVAAMLGELASQVAAALRPLLAEAVAARAVETVTAAVERAMTDPAGAALVVRGPAPLLAVIEARLTPGLAVRLEPDSGPEITVSGGDIAISTRLATALASLPGGDA